MFEVIEIQAAFMRHYGATKPQELNIPDGEYIVPVYDEDLNVRVTEGRLWIMPTDFDESKATRIGTGVESA